MVSFSDRARKRFKYEVVIPVGHFAEIERLFGNDAMPSKHADYDNGGRWTVSTTYDKVGIISWRYFFLNEVDAIFVKLRFG